MLYLAQVQKNESEGGVGLCLLAHQQSENSWSVISPQHVRLDDTNSLEDLLVLVELSEDQEVLNLQPARNWVLDIVQKYLTTGVTPSFLKEEAERTEQWRQDLTLQSQDLTRRHLEMEARREQIQTLEDELKQEKQRLELMADQLKTRTDELDIRSATIQTEEEKLKKAREQLELKALQLNIKTDLDA
ncbi:MAG: hypothetical protein WA919_24530 [Coleofasciculaceae cyanobacterium]